MYYIYIFHWWSPKSNEQEKSQPYHDQFVARCHNLYHVYKQHFPLLTIQAVITLVSIFCWETYYLWWSHRDCRNSWCSCFSIVQIVPTTADAVYHVTKGGREKGRTYSSSWKLHYLSSLSRYTANKSFHSMIKHWPIIVSFLSNVHVGILSLCHFQALKKNGKKNKCILSEDGSGSLWVGWGKKRREGRDRIENWWKCAAREWSVLVIQQQWSNAPAFKLDGPKGRASVYRYNGRGRLEIDPRHARTVRSRAHPKNQTTKCTIWRRTILQAACLILPSPLYNSSLIFFLLSNR